MAYSGAPSQKVSWKIASCKTIRWVRDGAWRALSARGGGRRLTVDQEVGDSSPPSCTSRINVLVASSITCKSPVSAMCPHSQVPCSQVLKLEQIAKELAGTFGNHDAVRLCN